MPSSFLKPFYWLLLGWLTTGVAAAAAVYPLPAPDNDVVGQVRVVYANHEDTLLDVARRHGLGYEEIIHANPGVDRWMPGQGTPIVLPTRHILPDAPREGIVLNLPEMRLYYYPPAGPDGQRVVHTFPVSIGEMDWKTPLGVTRVISKEIDPPWRPPASIKAKYAALGEPLPDVVPPGPDNPLGRHALRLSQTSYLIHGTNRPFGIGMRVTHGCVRMYPEDVERLFGMVPVGITVRIIDQPIKVGQLHGELFVAIHEPLEETELPRRITLEQVREAVAAKVGPELAGVDQTILQVAVEQVSGIAVSISAAPGTGSAQIGHAPPVRRFHPDYPTANRHLTPNPPPAGPYHANRVPRHNPPATAALPNARPAPPTAPGNAPSSHRGPAVSHTYADPAAASRRYPAGLSVRALSCGALPPTPRRAAALGAARR
jgi:L,D-transpeptidase ErfK/SrfK